MSVWGVYDWLDDELLRIECLWLFEIWLSKIEMIDWVINCFNYNRLSLCCEYKIIVLFFLVLIGYNLYKFVLWFDDYSII